MVHYISQINKFHVANKMRTVFFTLSKLWDYLYLVVQNLYMWTTVASPPQRLVREIQCLSNSSKIEAFLMFVTMAHSVLPTTLPTHEHFAMKRVTCATVLQYTNILTLFDIIMWDSVFFLYSCHCIQQHVGTWLDKKIHTGKLTVAANTCL